MDWKDVNRYLKEVDQSRFQIRNNSGPLKTGLDLGTACIVIAVLDERNRPVACEMKQAHVLKDGVVVDYIKALETVRELKAKLEKRLGRKLKNCAIAMPPGTADSVRTHRYVAEGAGFEVTKILEEPEAANQVFGITDGAVADIGGGTTGMALFRHGQIIRMEDEPTGGDHLSLVLSGHYHISFEEAEELKMDERKQEEILPVVRPVVEKMASIIRRCCEGSLTEQLYLCGGTCCLKGMENIVEKETGMKTVKPEYPFLVTPAGIAMSCVV